MSSVFDDEPVLLHRDIGLEAFNELPPRKALHALFECCSSVIMAADLAEGRPYRTRAALLSKADAVLSALSDESVQQIWQANRHHGAHRTVPRAEIAGLNRTRLELMLGPEGGYDNWV